MLSYLLMGLYVSWSLGQSPCRCQALANARREHRAISCLCGRAHSRALLGFASVLVVVLSVCVGGSIVLLCGVPVNGFVLQAVPFLVLALGTDFSFQVADALERAQLFALTHEKVGSGIEAAAAVWERSPQGRPPRR